MEGSLFSESDTLLVCGCLAQSYLDSTFSLATHDKLKEALIKLVISSICLSPRSAAAA